jgi:cytochrome bd-type quinol oxidase subunit 2
VTGFTAYKTWDTLMTYKWVILLGIILVILVIIFAWRSLKGSKEEDPEEE